MLYDRLLGTSVDQRYLAPELFGAMLEEHIRGRLTLNGLYAAIEAASSATLPPDERAEVSALVASVTQNPSRRDRLAEIRDVLRLAATGIPGYGDPAAVKARLES